MPQEKITIKFEPKGHDRLIAAINKLNTSTKKLTSATDTTAAATKRTTKAQDDYSIRGNKLARGNDALAKSFATLRSKMLLFTFAMSLGGRQVIQMVRDFAKVEAMSVAFDTLSGGVGNANIALTQLSNAVGGTMSRMDLLQTANNALILGVAKSSKEMNTMFGVAVKLGRAVGRTAKDSVDSLVTGIGRQSRMMLDNIGIIMNTEKAYAAYASKLGVTVESLNDTERRQAFLNATLEAAKEKADMLGDSVETLQSKLEKAGASWEDLGVSFGGFTRELVGLDTKITRSAEVFDILTKAMDENQDLTKKDWFIAKDNAIAVLKLLHRITHGYNKEIQEQNFGYREQANSIVDLTDEQNILFLVKNKSVEQEIKMKKLVSETTNAKLRSIDAAIDEVRGNKHLFETTKDYLDVLAMLEKQYKDLDPIEKERIANLKDIEKLDKDIARIERAIADEKARQANKKLTEEISRLRAELRRLNKERKEANRVVEETIKAQERLVSFMDGFRSKELEDEREFQLQKAMDLDAGLLQMQEIRDFYNNLILERDKEAGEKIISERKRRKKKDEDDRIEEFKKEQAIMVARIQIWSKGMSAISNILGANSKNAKLAANIQALAAVVDAFAAAQSSFAAAATHPLTVVNPAYPSIVYATTLANGLAQAAATKTAADKMEQGGLIGGRRHSQGGTMINAEAGEFVMSRDAVDSVGIENLNRMNQGGGGAITVNVSGNLLSSEYVEGELAEAIKEASRRGTDFGLS